MGKRKAGIFCSSRTGNTEQLAQAVMEVLKEKEIEAVRLPVDEAAVKEEMIFLGFWTDKGACSEEVRKFTKKLSGQKVFLFGTAGFGGSVDYFDKIIQRVKNELPKDCHLIGSFMCQGKMQENVRSRYEKMLAEDPENQTVAAMLHNFEEALRHPNETDRKALKQAITNCLEDMEL